MLSETANTPQGFTAKYFTNTSPEMLIKFAILATLFVPSIMATLSREEMAKTLITENEEDLVQTFKKFEKEQNHFELSCALGDVAKVPEHIPKVVTCLRTAVDPFPKEMSRVGILVHHTVGAISNNTHDDAESFAKVFTSFKSSDVKPLASIRYRILWRNDAVKVVESVMEKSPTLITGDLPRWLANHLFDQNSSYYTRDKVAREQAFQYLTSFATEDVLNDALSIVTRNEHYKVDSRCWCCNSHDSFPQDLYNKLSALLIVLKREKHLSKSSYSHFYHRCLSS